MSDFNILVLEDEAMIAMDIEMTLEEAGFDKIAVCSTVEQALAQIETCEPNLALLDFNLGKGDTSVLVAKRLAERGVPVIFLSGYTEATGQIPDDLGHAARLAKPFHGAQLVAQVQSALQGG